MNEEQPVIIKKLIKKVGHAGHHGGAWKVAYADFVTAMMCLFLLLWLVNADPSSKAVIAEYFRQPSTSGPTDGNVFVFGGAKKPTDPGRFEGGSSFLEFEKLSLTRENKEQIRKLIEEEFKKQLESTVDDELYDRVKISLTEDGILIELKENDQEPLFNSGSSSLTTSAIRIVDKLSIALRNKTAPIIISGHTDSQKYQLGAYDNWNLSTDRAHAVRKRALYAGIDPKRIVEVAGYADTQLKLPEAPFASINRRITLLLLQEGEEQKLKPKYINPEEENEILQRDLTVELAIRKESEMENSSEDYIRKSAGKPKSHPTLEELRRIKKIRERKKSNPNKSSGGDSGH
jgi:chemotaxis protein MotB